MLRIIFSYTLFTIILIFSSRAFAQNQVITIEDMAGWEYIGDHDLSHSGEYLSYVVKKENDDPKACIYQASTEKTLCFDRSDKVRFSQNERWAIMTTVPAMAHLDSLKRRDVKKDDLPPDTMKILDLQTMEVTSIPDVSKTVMLDSMPDILIYQLGSLPKNEEDTTEQEVKEINEENGFPLIVRRISNGTEDTLHYVTNWHASENGPFMTAMTTGKDSTDAQSILAYDLRNGDKKMVRETDGKIHQTASDRKGMQLAWILDEDTTKAYVRPYQLFYWTEGMDSMQLLLEGPTEDLMEGSRIKDSYTPKFTYDGEKLIFGFNHPAAIQDTALLEKEIIDVEVWSTKDPLLYTMQNEQIEEAREKVYHAVLDLASKKIVRLTDTFTDHIILNDKVRGKYAAVYHNETYLPHIVFEAHDYKDLYGLDLTTGERWLIQKRVHGYPNLSPSGELLVWHDPGLGQWRAHDLKQRKTYTWTNDEIGEFEDELNDRPREPYSYGMAGLSPDENSAYIYDRFDIWRFDTRKNLSGEKITDGREGEIMHRLIKMDRDADYITPSKQMIFRFSEKNKGSGYGWLDMETGEMECDEIQPYKYEFRPQMSGDSSTIVYTKENYQTAPDLLISPLKEWSNSTRVTDLQSQKEGFNWGNIQHIEWDDHEGLLVLPDDYEDGKRYPLIVNFYERSSDRLHNYRRPYLHRSTINYPHYASRGYIVFNPDIVYQVGDPGKSALDIVESGVRHLISQGMIDEDRVSLQGHSWGGYQIAHIVTQSDMFTCAESGAPVVNMTSAYGGIRWGTGMSRMFQYEQTQSRLGKTLWEDLEVYLRNSPLFNVDKVTTPLLILHNDEDQAVPWYQGIEFYMALRRLNKDAWFLNYRGEPHWPVKFENRKDFQTRMMQFFDHYMLDEPMPLWMKEGVPAYLRGIEDGLRYSKE